MVRAADLNALLEKMDLTPEKIEEIYDRFEAMNIQIVTADLELDLGDDLELGMDGDIGSIEVGKKADFVFVEAEAFFVVHFFKFKLFIGAA